MSKSIVQAEPDIFNPPECFLCGAKVMLEKHHIMAGSNRRLSEHYGLHCLLCYECHRGQFGAQYDREKGDYLKQQAQMAFEELYGHEMWMETFRKNYL